MARAPFKLPVYGIFNEEALRAENVRNMMAVFPDNGRKTVYLFVTEAEARKFLAFDPAGHLVFPIDDIGELMAMAFIAASKPCQATHVSMTWPATSNAMPIFMFVDCMARAIMNPKA